jgi:ferredoxin-nitrite reductase
MSTTQLPIQAIDGQPLTTEQTTYLSGFFAGVKARGLRFSDVEAAPEPKQVIPLDDLIFEERVKRELHPLDSYPRLLEYAASGSAPEKDDLFRFKWNGLFFLTPTKEAYMARLRIPGGVLNTYQLREIAKVAQSLTTGYVQITTRANFQIRLIQPKDAPEVLRRIQAVGLHTRGAGADNIRNITANPTAGVDPHELIDVMPFCNELAQIIINDRAFYDMPRKFNIAYDGGGLIGTVEDTNDIGAKAVRISADAAPEGIEPGVYFRIAIGGATGHKAFARDLGVLVRPEELNKVIVAMVRVFITNGNRTDRKKARLKHLLEKWTLDQYLEETEKLLGYQLIRLAADATALEYPGQDLPHSHVGTFKQKQLGLNYIGATVPVGQMTPKQIIRIAEIADLYGSGEVRLTVWQNFIIPNVPDAFLATAVKALRKAGFPTEQNHLRSGIIACTGNAYCKYAQANTKANALDLANYLEKKITLDQPINIHLTGCPHSCAQHYMGDIGLLGTKVRIGGESVEGYHVFVGGGFGKHQAVGRQVFTGVAFGDLTLTLEKILRGYLRHRQGSESFKAFTERYDLNGLQAIFSNEE